jgi:hypothetical protein
MTGDVSPTRRVRVSIVVAIVGGLLVAFGVARLDVDVTIADIEYDWLAARAAIHGNAYDPVLSLAKDEGVEVLVVKAADGSTDVVHPRTPGALLLLLPLRWIPFRYLVALISGLSAAVVIWFAWSWLSSRGPPLGRRLLLLGLGILAAPVLMTFAYASQSLVVAGLVVGALVGSSRGKRILPALLAASAIVLKLYPAALVVVWWVRGQRKLVYRTIGAVAGLTVLGLLLPGVSLVDSWHALRSAELDFIRVPTNGSLAAILISVGIPVQAASVIGPAILVLLVGCAAVWRRSVPPSAVLALVIFLLLQPVAWVEFDVVLLPFVVVALADSKIARTTDSYPLIVWLVLTACWFAGISVIGELAFLARGALLLALMSPRNKSRSEGVMSGVAGVLEADVVAAAGLSGSAGVPGEAG